MKKNTEWIQTYTGKRIYPFEPDIELIDIKDIAHALSLMCRYTGHCKHFYSVAQHSIIVSEIAPLEYKLEGLLHDASEAYLNDIARPVKKYFKEYRLAEYNLQKVISEKFKLNNEGSKTIKIIDDGMLYWEEKYLMNNIDGWPIKQPYFKLNVTYFNSLLQKDVEKWFLDIFEELKR